MSQKPNDDGLFTGGLGLLINGFRITQAIYVVAKLKIPDLLVDIPRTAEELAELTSSNAIPLGRVLRVLAAFGILEELEGERFGLTTKGHALRSDLPATMWHMAILSGEDFFWQPWGNLLGAVRTGENAFTEALGMENFEYRLANPEIHEIFNAGQTQGTLASVQKVLEGYDFSEYKTIADIGGGQGALIRGVLNANPNAKGILLDRPSVVEGIEKVFSDEGLGDRCDIIGGDAFEVIPSGIDLLMMKAVVHGFSDEQAEKLLKVCHASIVPNGRLLIIERVVSPHGKPSPYTLGDLHMLVMTGGGGAQRTEIEYVDLLDRSGFRFIRTIDLETEQSIVEAVRV